MLSNLFSELRNRGASQLFHDVNDLARSPYVSLGLAAAWILSQPASRRHHLRQTRTSTHVTAVAGFDAMVARLRAEHRRLLCDPVAERLFEMAVEEGEQEQKKRDGDDDENDEFEDFEDEEEEQGDAEKESDDNSASSSHAISLGDPAARRDDEIVALVLELPLSTFGTVINDVKQDRGLVAQFSRLIAEDFEEEDEDDEDDDDDDTSDEEDVSSFTYVDLLVEFQLLVVTPLDNTQADMLVTASALSNQKQQSPDTEKKAQDNLAALSASISKSTRNKTILLSFGFLRSLALGQCIRLAAFFLQHLIHADAADSQQEFRSMCRDALRLCFAVLAVKAISFKEAASAGKNAAADDDSAAVPGLENFGGGAAEEEEEDEACVVELSKLLSRLLQQYREISGISDSLCCYSRDLTAHVVSLQQFLDAASAQKQQQQQLQIERAELIARGESSSSSVGGARSLFASITSSVRALGAAVFSDFVPVLGQWPAVRRALRWIPAGALSVHIGVQIFFAVSRRLATTGEEADTQSAELARGSGSNGAAAASPFPTLLESVARAALHSDTLSCLAQLALKSTNVATDASVSTRLYLFAATADFGRDGVSGIFDSASKALAVVPSITEQLSWLMHRKAENFTLLLLVWRQPALIALALMVKRVYAVLEARSEKHRGLGELFAAVESRVAAKRERRLRAALTLSSSSAAAMHCLDPLFCEPLMVPTRGDDPAIAVGGADDDDEHHDSGSDGGGEINAETDDVASDADADDDDDAAVPEDAIGVAPGGEEDEEEIQWQFAQIEIGVNMLDANAQQERSLRRPTLGLALLASALLPDVKTAVSVSAARVDDEHQQQPAVKTAKKNSSSSSRRIQRPWAVIPHLEQHTILHRLLLDSGGDSVFSLLRIPSTPLLLNRKLEHVVTKACPQLQAIHSAASDALEQQQEQEQKKQQSTQHHLQQQQQQPQLQQQIARYVIGRRYSLAPRAEDISKLFDTHRFRAMRAAGFEVETLVAASAALLANSSAQLVENNNMNSTVMDFGDGLKYVLLDGAQEGVVQLAGEAMLARQRQQQQQQLQEDEDEDEDHEHDPRIALRIFMDGATEFSAIQKTVVRPSVLNSVVGDVADLEVLEAYAAAHDVTHEQNDFEDDGEVTVAVLDNPIPTGSSAAGVVADQSTAIDGQSLLHEALQRGKQDATPSTRAESDAVGAWIARQSKSSRSIDPVSSANSAAIAQQAAAHLLSSARGGAASTTTTTTPIWEFRNVCFAYPSDPQRLVLHGISFTIQPGAFVGIVGLSGSGKSTLLALMLRIYEPTRGEILLHGIPLRFFSPRWLRRHLAYVGPLCGLLGAESDGTAVDEVWAAEPLAVAEDVEASLQQALVPDKMFVADGGGGGGRKMPSISTMSGGEAQRVQIARAFAKMQQQQHKSGGGVLSLLFDEGTSSLDSKTEDQIVKAIDEKSSQGQQQQKQQRVARICVAHRLFTVRDCDELFIVFRGRLIARGTFWQCLATATAAANPHQQKKSSSKKKNQQQTLVDAEELSPLTLRGLTWFLRSVQAQQLRGEEDLPGGGGASSACKLFNAAADEADEDEDEDEDDVSNDVIAAELGPDASDTASLLAMMRAVPDEQKQEVAAAVQRVLGDEAFAVLARLSQN